MKGTITFLRFGAVWVALMLLTGSLFANYLRVRNVTYDQVQGTVTFDLTWDNSWRIDGMGAPNHWDAAWVFVKWRECSAPVTQGWTHGLVSTTLGDHSFGNYEPTVSDGTAVGIDAGPENTGVMLRQDSVGLFPTGSYSTITLKLSNLPATGDYDVRVFGIEMVYVPKAPFLLGGINENSRFIGPVVISSENDSTLNGALTFNLPAAYPKGYNAFYCMKYEISQGQYAAFLNTLMSSHQVTHFTNTFNSYRHRINSGGAAPDLYYSDRPDRACNYMRWTSLLAYLDWACLRPMTEGEFEKACRGEGPYVGAYAWGTNDITAATLISTPEDGTEIIQTAGANANYNNTLFTGGDGDRGPLRVGIYATASTSSRVETGASYYGIMELSGNLWEQCVPVYNDTLFTNYQGGWGDGYVEPVTGLADVFRWPNKDCASNSSNCYHSLRGGGFDSPPTYLRISDRYNYYHRYNNVGIGGGGRGVR